MSAMLAMGVSAVINAQSSATVTRSATMLMGYNTGGGGHIEDDFQHPELSQTPMAELSQTHSAFPPFEMIEGIQLSGAR